MEWVFDGKDVWVVKLQQETALSHDWVSVPGHVATEVEFHVTKGLDALRGLIAIIKGTNSGIKLIGRVGLTSHVTDILRRHNAPSRMSP